MFGGFKNMKLAARPLVRKIVRAVVVLLPLSFLSAGASAPAAYEGVATCAGSACHGRIEGDGKVVRQDELSTWQNPSSQSGAHSRAWAVLGSTRGQAIARSLGLGDAREAVDCLGCHATPPGPRGERFQISDGVGCESCHGPATNWIASHAAVGTSHADNIRAGMIALERPQVRASVCLDCHFGSAKSGQFVDHRMMAAGHPRVNFELDLFSTLQQHWDEDADYHQRKGATSGLQMWAVGQAEAVRRIVSLYADARFGQQGAFPELYFFDCQSCHRRIYDGPNRNLTFEPNPARAIPFGTPPFNDENFIMLSAIAHSAAPQLAQRFDADARAFHAALGKGRGEAVTAAARLNASAQALSDALAARPISLDIAFAAAARIGAQPTLDRFTDYAGAMQAVMTVDTLLNALVKEKRITIGAAAGIRASINRAYAAVRDNNAFDPPAFRTALRQATGAIGSLR